MNVFTEPGPSSRLFEARRKVLPKAVKGPFRRFKWAVMVLTLLIYYATPWLRWDRGAWAPDQAVLVDLAHRRFYFFSIEIWPHEFYYVAGLLVMAAIGLFLVTSAVGRAWCGYTCPQTVWTDLFQHVERLVEGDRNAQLRLLAAPWGPNKLARRVTKHAIWIMIAVLTGGAWIFYFADAPTLARQIMCDQRVRSEQSADSTPDNDDFELRLHCRYILAALLAFPSIKRICAIVSRSVNDRRRLHSLHGHRAP